VSAAIAASAPDVAAASGAGSIRRVYSARMLRRLAFVLCATTAAAPALAPAPAAAEPWGFAWAGRIERDGAPLFDPDADPEARRAAVSALRAYDPVLTRRFVLKAIDDEDDDVRIEAARVAAQGRLIEAVPRLITWPDPIARPRSRRRAPARSARPAAPRRWSGRWATSTRTSGWPPSTRWPGSAPAAIAPSSCR
jgi:hypothetical protein